MQETATATPAPAEGTATATPAPDFESFAAELAAKPPEPEKPAEPEPTEAPEEGEKPEETEDEAEEPAEEEKPETDEAPATVSKQLAAINRAKARADAELARTREAISRERAEVEQLKERYQGIEQRAAAFEQAAKRAKYDLPALCKQLGVTDMVEAARQLYYASPEGLEKNGEEAKRYQRSNAIEEQALEAKSEVAKLRAELEQERNLAKRERAVTQFLTEAKDFHAKAPLVARLAKDHPDDYREEIEQVAVSMHAKGQKVTAETVIATYEARLAKRAGLKTETKTKTQIQPSRENKTAQTLGTEPKTSQGPRPATSTAVTLDDLEAFAAEVRGG